jgi:hypothetical protein
MGQNAFVNVAEKLFQKTTQALGYIQLEKSWHNFVLTFAEILEMD